MPRHRVEEVVKLNREAWLTELARGMEPMFRRWDLGQYRVTCGWPVRGALSRRRRVIGQCFGVEWSPAGLHELFISPVLDKPAEVSGTLAHEMAHVAAGVEAAHGKGFITVCAAVGLTKGKPTSVGPGEALAANLAKLTDRLGPYPHTALVPVLKSEEKKRTTARLVCAGCGCVAVMSFKWLAESGPPACGCGTGEMGLGE